VVGSVSERAADVFDVERLDRNLDEAGIDLLLATSRHNVAYLLGGYRFFFFDVEDAIGRGRYCPILGYPRERPDDAFYLGNPLEDHQQAFEPLWVRTIELPGFPGADFAVPCARHIRELGLDRATIGIEPYFLPTEIFLQLSKHLPHARLVSAFACLEDLRAVKRADELQLIREASVRIVDSMVATFDRAQAGITTHELMEIMRQEETARGLVFDYCFTTCGPDCNRAPSTRRWEPGTSINLDSGGRYRGYVGDLARGAVLETASPLQEELLEEVDAVQMAARKAVRPGALAEELYVAAEAQLHASPNRERMDFLAHGMGLIGHEAPRITSHGPVPYPGVHAHRPLEAGMVLSIETSMRHTTEGFVKLEDTVLVVDDGFEAVADHARKWTVVA
jgi:Xaa-Pro aminopeptidase